MLRIAGSRFFSQLPMSGDSPVPVSVDASGLKIAVVAARFNGELVDALLGRVLGALSSAGVKDRNVTVERVPGSNELPVAVRLIVDKRKPDAVVALGVIIRGGTIHFELIANAATNGLMDVALSSRVPVINGVIVAENPAQARARCRGPIDRGAEFAHAAVSMAALRRRLSK
jgi:6,7-dimethyl-8-ribityllumazine synthase